MYVQFATLCHVNDPGQIISMRIRAGYLTRRAFEKDVNAISMGSAAFTYVAMASSHARITVDKTHSYSGTRQIQRQMIL